MIRFLFALTVALIGCTVQAAPKTGGPSSPDGKATIQTDLPVVERIKNIGSKKDGAGMCVFSSCEMSMRWAGVESYRGWRDWCAANYTGGGWPDRVDQLMTAYSKAKGVPVPLYLNYQGKDPAVLQAALASGRMPSITYDGRDDFYKGSVSHMTNLAYLDGSWAGVLDNNHPNDIVWMTPAELNARWSGWAVIYLAPPPPPIPVSNFGSATKVFRFDQADPLPRFGVDGSRLPGRRDEESVFQGTRYEWRYYRSVPKNVLLCRGEREVGAYDPATGIYRSYDEDTKVWGPKTAPPFAAPDLPEDPQSDPVLCGVVTDYGVSLQTQSEPERITLNGQRISKTAALELLVSQRPQPKPRPEPAPGPRNPNLPDDAKLLRLTAWGADAAKVTSDLGSAAALAPWKGKLVVQSYDSAAHWHLSSVGLDKLGPAGVAIQAPPGADGKGRVLSFSAAYGGPDSLATALRRADPLWDPSKTPDLSKTPGPGGPGSGNPLAPLGTAALVLGGVAAATALASRRRSQTKAQPPQFPWSIL